MFAGPSLRRSSLYCSKLYSSPSYFNPVLFLNSPRTRRIMSTTTTTTSTTTTTMQANHSQGNEKYMDLIRQRVKTVLDQDRQVLNFEHYRTSVAHQQRLTALTRMAPELYDNPDITPRAKWFSHPMYRRNSQMPPFHVHFRQEMQHVVSCLWDALSSSSSSSSQQQQELRQKHVRRASQIFQGSMRGLHGHVSIEEYACFPVYQQTFPRVNLSFLVDDHKELHRAEQHVKQILSQLHDSLSTSNGGNVQDYNTNNNGTNHHHDDDDDGDSDKLLYTALEVVLDYDEQLMAHLGEEEEIVVPLSLTEKPIWF